MQNLINLVLSSGFLYWQSNAASPSQGERTWVYVNCRIRCRNECAEFHHHRSIMAYPWPMYERLLGWTCTDQCKYACMWRTVTAYQMDRSTVIPKFYGQWPFLRVFGIERPVAFILCTVNMLLMLIILIYFRRKVPHTAPMYYVWHVFIMTAWIQWFISAVYHTRQYLKIEVAFQISRMFLLISSVWLLLNRILIKQAWWKTGSVLLVLLTWLTYHITHHLLYFLDKHIFHQDYDRKATVLWGILSVLMWMFWCVKALRELDYVWKAEVSLILTWFLLVLCNVDFAPVFWMFDSTTLSYAGMIVAEIYLGSFAVADCLYLTNEEKGSLFTEKEKYNNAITEDNVKKSQ